jgi:uncharacterized protein YqgQ
MVLVDYIGIFFTCGNTFGYILYMHLANNSYDMRIFVNMNCVFHSLSETQLQFIIHFEYSILDFSDYIGIFFTCGNTFGYILYMRKRIKRYSHCTSSSLKT